MRISPEFREKLVSFIDGLIQYEAERTKEPWPEAEELLEGLTYKKRGRKVGWRKRPEIVVDKAL